MIKRLLNLHTITKIALILTTLLLLPSVAVATKYDTTGKQVKPMTSTGNANVHYGWDVNNGIKWTISYVSGDVSITSGGETTLQFTLNASKTITLTTTKPTSESGDFRKIILDGLDEKLSTTVTFGSTTLTSNSTGVFAPESPITWGTDDAIIITITNKDTEGEITCTINSITFLTGTLSNREFSWGKLTASDGYDTSGITKSENEGNTTLQGHCEVGTQFHFPLTAPESPSISYSSNNTSVAQVDNDAVTIMGAGEATITATPEGTDNEYYASHSYTINITNLDEYCGLKVAGIRVTTGNKDNILNDIHKSVSYNPEAHTLTLKGAEIKENCDAVIVEDYNISKLTAHIIGYNKIGRDGYKCFNLGESSTLEITTSEKLPGYIQYYGTFVDDMEKVQLPEGFKQVTGEVNEIGKISENTSISPFTGRVENITTDSEPFIYTGISSSNIYNSTDYKASNATLSGNTVIVSSQGGATATLRPSNLYDIDRVQKVIFQFDWGTYTNKNVTVQIRGMKEDNQTWSEDGNNYSKAISLNTADKDGIIEIPLTKAITSDNIELYFSSDASFSFVPLTIAMSLCEDYGINILGRGITELNKEDVLGDGKISYNPEGNTLTLKGATIIPEEGSDFPGIMYYDTKPLYVKLEGTNTMTNAIFRAYNNDIQIALNFIIETDKPGTLTMTNKNVSNSTLDFNEVKTDFIEGFIVNYNNALYQYNNETNTPQNQDDPTTYTGTYTISVLKPVISSYIVDKRNFEIENPMSGDDETIKYSISYADGSEGINNATYTGACPITKPATITSYIQHSNNSKSATTTAYYFGVSPNPLKLTYGSEAPQLNLSLIPSDIEGVDITQINGPYGITETKEMVTSIVGLGKGNGYVQLSTNSDPDYIILNDTIGFELEVVPEVPSFSVDEGTYEEAQTLTLSSPFTARNQYESVSIKYYLGEETGYVQTYTEGIDISYSNKITAWVEVEITPETGGPSEIFKSEMVTKEYKIKRKPYYNFFIADGDDSKGLEDGETVTCTYGSAKPEIYITDTSELKGSLVFSSSNESVVASNTISMTLDEDKEMMVLNYTIKAAGETTISASYTPLTDEPLFSKTLSFKLKVNPRDISGGSLTLSESSFTYTASAIVPTPTVSLAASESASAVTLTKDTDYTITCTDNTNVGTATITATGTGNYTGTLSATFNITKATISPTVTLEGWTYGATANEPSVTGNTGNGEVTYAYKLQNAAEDAYTATKPTNAGAYTVKANIAATTNYEAATDSAHFTIAKAAGGLSYSAATASAELNGDGWTAPELQNPNNLTVTYTSSNTAVATISEAGAVTLAGIGETTIKAASAGDANHEASEAQYVLTVSRGKAKGYGVWIGETEVDEDNKDDILGDEGTGEEGKERVAPSFMFNPDDNTLLVIGSDEGLTIESRISELKIHLSQDNKLKKIFYNNQGNSENTGTLLFTCDSNFPGTATIGNTAGESAITGFASVSYEFNLTTLVPEKAKYANGQMTDSLGVAADTITVGTPLKPLQGDENETLNPDDFTVTNPDGSTATVDLTSANVNNILYTLPEGTDGQGYDPETNTICVVDPMTDEDVEKIAATTTNNTTTVGSSDYAENFVGLTFIIQGGEGVIKIDQEAEEGYEFHLKIGDDPSITLNSGKEEISYNLPDATYCWLYLVRKAAAARRIDGTRVGKRDRSPGSIRSVKVQPASVKASKSASEASGGKITEATNETITGIVEIKNETTDSRIDIETTSNKWYTIDGRQINKPTQKGLYIRNRKKFVIK